MENMKGKNFLSRLVSCAVAAGLVVSLTGCFKTKVVKPEPGVVNEDVTQTEFSIMGGMSALSKGYENNEVLN